MRTAADSLLPGGIRCDMNEKGGRMTTDRLRAFCEASIEAAETVGAWYDVEWCPVRRWTLFGYAALRGSAACISATSLPDEETALVVAATHNWLLADGAAGGHAVRPPLTYLSTAYQAALRDSVDKGALTRTVRESTVVID